MKTNQSLLIEVMSHKIFLLARKKLRILDLVNQLLLVMLLNPHRELKDSLVLLKSQLMRMRLDQANLTAKLESSHLSMLSPLFNQRSKLKIVSSLPNLNHLKQLQ